MFPRVRRVARPFGEMRASASAGWASTLACPRACCAATAEPYLQRNAPRVCRPAARVRAGAAGRTPALSRRWSRRPRPRGRRAPEVPLVRTERPQPAEPAPPRAGVVEPLHGDEQDVTAGQLAKAGADAGSARRSTYVSCGHATTASALLTSATAAGHEPRDARLGVPLRVGASRAKVGARKTRNGCSRENGRAMGHEALVVGVNASP
jgi:hypothetical protein